MRLVSEDIWPILTIVGEAEGESYAGKLAVAEVIRNRAAQKYNCDGTLEDACLHRLQFSCWNGGDPGRLRMAKADQSRPSVAECVKAWNGAKTGTDTTKGAVLYHAKSILAPGWTKGSDLVADIGSHLFYKPKAV